LETFKFLTDEDFRTGILDGIRRRLPDLDIVRVQDVGLRTFRDEIVLEFAASEKRIVLTHDLKTMGGHALARVAAGKPMPGVFLIRQDLPFGRAIDEIVMVVACSPAKEWNSIIQHLPL
jgi:predicted nuclease of predicted toxin-antitoxin system